MTDRSNATVRMIVVGVGGQGCVTAARVIGDAANAAGLDVRIGELHGMSQRGGSVEASLVIGPGRTSMVGPGEADVVVALEPIEALRLLPRLGAHTHVLLNRGRVVPFLLTLQGGDYPPVESIVERLEAAVAQVYVVDGTQLAHEAAAPRAVNVVILGALAGLDLLPCDAEALNTAVQSRSPVPFREANRRAFDAGLAAVGKESRAQR